MQIHTNLPLKDILYYKIGGPARFVLEIHNQHDLSEAFTFLRKNNIQKVLPLGSGANVLMSDEGFDGVILWFARAQEGITIDKTTVTAFTSVWLDDLIHAAFKHNLVGLEWAGGLPSTVGAGVRGNIGAFGGKMEDVVKEIEVINLNSSTFEKQTFTKTELQFGYRESLIKRNKQYLITQVTLVLESATPERIAEAIKEYKDHKEYRKTHHPLEYPSCGSVFKNVVDKKEVEKMISVWPDMKESVEKNWYGKVSIGYVIDRLGFTGYRIGNAQVSEKHSNYIVNLGDAKASDVMNIINEIKNKFFETFGLPLEAEVEIIT